MGPSTKALRINSSTAAIQFPSVVMRQNLQLNILEGFSSVLTLNMSASSNVSFAATLPRVNISGFAIVLAESSFLYGTFSLTTGTHLSVSGLVPSGAFGFGITAEEYSYVESPASVMRFAPKPFTPAYPLPTVASLTVAESGFVSGLTYNCFAWSETSIRVSGGDFTTFLLLNVILTETIGLVKAPLVPGGPPSKQKINLMGNVQFLMRGGPSTVRVIDVDRIVGGSIIKTIGSGAVVFAAGSTPRADTFTELGGVWGGTVYVQMSGTFSVNQLCPAPISALSPGGFQVRVETGTKGNLTTDADPWDPAVVRANINGQLLWTATSNPGPFLLGRGTSAGSLTFGSPGIGGVVILNGCEVLAPTTSLQYSVNVLGPAPNVTTILRGNRYLPRLLEWRGTVLVTRDPSYPTSEQIFPYGVGGAVTEMWAGASLVVGNHFVQGTIRLKSSGVYNISGNFTSPSVNYQLVFDCNDTSLDARVMFLATQVHDKQQMVVTGVSVMGASTLGGTGRFQFSNASSLIGAVGLGAFQPATLLGPAIGHTVRLRPDPDAPPGIWADMWLTGLSWQGTVSMDHDSRLLLHCINCIAKGMVAPDPLALTGLRGSLLLRMGRTTRSIFATTGGFNSTLSSGTISGPAWAVPDNATLLANGLQWTGINIGIIVYVANVTFNDGLRVEGTVTMTPTPDIVPIGTVVSPQWVAFDGCWSPMALGESVSR